MVGKRLLTAQWGRVWPGWRRPLRWLIQIAILVLGFVVFLPATNDNLDADVSNLHLVAAPPIWLIGVTVPLWQAPERGRAQALRLRSLHRRVLWRVSALLLLAASLASVVAIYGDWRADQAPTYLDAAYNHAHAYSLMAGSLGLWLLICSPLPGLLDPLIWRLWPKSLRDAVRRARGAETAMEPTRFTTPVLFDPERGAAGRPKALCEQPGGTAPIRQPRSALLSPGTIAERLGHLPAISLTWDGTTLALVRDGRPPIPVPLEGQVPQLPPDLARGRIRRPVAELAWYTESHPPPPRGSWSGPWARTDTGLVLLDADGLRVGRVERVSDDWRTIAKVAAAAGVGFTAYDMGFADEDSPRLGTRLFPRRGRQVTLSAD